MIFAVKMNHRRISSRYKYHGRQNSHYLDKNEFTRYKYHGQCKGRGPHPEGDKSGRGPAGYRRASKALVDRLRFLRSSGGKLLL